MPSQRRKNYVERRKKETEKEREKERERKRERERRREKENGKMFTKNDFNLRNIHVISREAWSLACRHIASRKVKFSQLHKSYIILAFNTTSSCNAI